MGVRNYCVDCGKGWKGLRERGFMSSLTVSKMVVRCAGVKWRHQIEITSEFRTPGDQSWQFTEWTLGALPQDLSGKSVLDVGAWDGYCTFEARRRNADRVVAIDTGTHRRGIAGFEVAKQLLAEVGQPVDRIEYYQADVQDAEAVTNLGKFDYVMFFGVIYHLVNPYGAMCNLAKVTKNRMVLEGHYLNPGGYPEGCPEGSMAYFYDAYELGNDPSVFWGFSDVCMGKMAIRAGFKAWTTVDSRGSRVLMEFVM